MLRGLYPRKNQLAPVEIASPGPSEEVKRIQVARFYRRVELSQQGVPGRDSGETSPGPVFPCRVPDTAVPESEPIPGRERIRRAFCLESGP